MSKLDLFRGCIRERLTTAALEIFGAVEQMFAEYKEEICRSKEESARLKRLLNFVTQAEIQRHRAGRVTRERDSLWNEVATFMKPKLSRM